MCFGFLFNFCLKHFSFWEELSEIWSKLYIGLHVKYRLLLADLNENRIFSYRFSKNTENTKFYENPSTWSRVFFSCGLTDGQTWRSWYSNFWILRTSLKIYISYSVLTFTISGCVHFSLILSCGIKRVLDFVVHTAGDLKSPASNPHSPLL